MFETFKQDDELQLKKETEQSKKALLSVFSSTKALALMLLSVISFGVSTYFYIVFISTEVVFSVGTEMIYFSDYHFIFYIAIALSALLPLFYVNVYLHARRSDAYLTAKWLQYAKVFLQIGFVISIIGAAFGTVSVLGIMFVRPLLGILVFFLTIALFGLSLWIMWLIIYFFRSMMEDLQADTIHQKANPKAMIVLTWITLVLSAFTFISSGFDQSDLNYLLPQHLINITNQLSLFMGMISFMMTAVMLSVLYDIKNKYTNL